MSFIRTKVSCLSRTFLSRLIKSRQVSAFMSVGGVVGNPALSMTRMVFARASAVIRLESTENFAAMHMPAAIASPCNQLPYPCAVSIAWPKVWPRFSSARTPASRSSAATMRALLAQQRATACERVGLSRCNSVGSCSSSQSKNSASSIRPVESVHIGNHTGGLVERANHVLTHWVVHTGLATD